MCPEDCKTDVTNAFTACGLCLTGADQLYELQGLIDQKTQLESNKMDLQNQITACECKDSWYYIPVTDPTTGEELEQRKEMVFNGCDARQPDEAEPWCFVKNPTQCAEATLSEGKDGEQLGFVYCETPTSQRQLDQVTTELNQVTVGIQRLQAVEQSCVASAPTFNTLQNEPLSLPQGDCLAVVRRFALLKEVMTAQAIAGGKMPTLSEEAQIMMQELGKPGVKLQDGALPNGPDCVTCLNNCKVE